jgi:hypothetical protein
MLFIAGDIANFVSVCGPILNHCLSKDGRPVKGPILVIFLLL